MFSNDTYFVRYKPNKAKFIHDFVLKNGLKSVFDVGCNRGDITYPLMEKGVEVFGVDGGDVTPREGYPFMKTNVMEHLPLRFQDCTVFLSTYHHIYKKNPNLADTIFYQLLLRSKYLIFDTGNVSEIGRINYDWYRAQPFKSEKELLDHFGVPYKVLGDWEVAGGKRTVVVYAAKDFKPEVVKEYRKICGTQSCKLGLVDPSDKRVRKQNNKYFKLKLGGRLFFGKKTPSTERELGHVIKAHEYFDKENLIPFYGMHEEYGLLWDWVDFEYVGKVHRDEKEKHDVDVRDIDIIMVDGVKKYIDFEKSTLK